MKWKDIYDIADALEDLYPEVDIINLRYSDFHNWIINLSEFNDNPQDSNEKILEAIHTAWMENRG